jgi:hypothetical protein
MKTVLPENTPTAMWQRIVQPHEVDLSPEEARAVLRWKFSAKDLDRVDSLSAKARSGTLSETEERELDDYLVIGNVLGFVQSKARLSLKRAGLPA